MHLVFIGTLGLLATASGALAKGRTRGPCSLQPRATLLLFPSSTQQRVQSKLSTGARRVTKGSDQAGVVLNAGGFSKESGSQLHLRSHYQILFFGG